MNDVCVTDDVENVPILRPSILVLTKIKRCVQYIGSTRPKSISKLESDLSDVEFLLQWLRARGQTIDFDGYDTTDDKRERLCMAVKSRADHLKEIKSERMIELLRAVLSSRDREALDV
jgi:hypothetical protein